MPSLPDAFECGEIRPDDIKNILIVCSGNICRSPMAEGYLRKRLHDIRNRKISVMSAGTLGLFNQKASDHAQTIGDNHGFDLSEHRSFPAEPSVVMEADLILCMELSHIAFLKTIAPDKMNRMFLLGAFTDGNPAKEIDDPIGGSYEDYEIAFEKIKASVDSLIAWLIKND